MYFVTQDGSVYHVLGDEGEGAAPCGTQPSKHDLECLMAGEPTPRFFAEKPQDIPPCKICEKEQED